MDVFDDQDDTVNHYYVGQDDHDMELTYIYPCLMPNTVYVHGYEITVKLNVLCYFWGQKYSQNTN